MDDYSSDDTTFVTDDPYIADDNAFADPDDELDELKDFDLPDDDLNGLHIVGADGQEVDDSDKIDRVEDGTKDEE